MLARVPGELAQEQERESAARDSEKVEGGNGGCDAERGERGRPSDLG